MTWQEESKEAKFLEDIQKELMEELKEEYWCLHCGGHGIINGNYCSYCGGTGENPYYDSQEEIEDENDFYFNLNHKTKSKKIRKK